jgi:hypothetical protein
MHQQSEITRQTATSKSRDGKLTDLVTAEEPWAINWNT